MEISGCDTVELAKRFKTPLYVMDENRIRQNCRDYTAGLAEVYPKARVCYAGKAFLCKALCRLVEQEGLGLDVVSGGELFTALAAEFPPEKIFFHGNNKSPEELRYALENRVGCLVVDGFYEIELLEKLAVATGTRPRVLLRVTPGVEAHTHVTPAPARWTASSGWASVMGRLCRNKRIGISHMELEGFHAISVPRS